MCAEMWGIDNLATMTGIMMLMIAPGERSGGAVGGAIFDATGGSWTALIVYGGVMMTVGSFFILPCECCLFPIYDLNIDVVHSAL